MPLVTNPYAATLLLSALAVLALGAAAWARRWDARGGRSLAAVSLAATVWALAEVGWLGAETGAAGILVVRVVASIGALLPLLLLAFAFDATRLFPRLRLPALVVAALPSLTVVALALGPVGGLSLWSGVRPGLVLGRAVAVVEPDLYGFVAAAYGALLVAGAVLLLTLATGRTPAARRAPLTSALAGVGLPVTAEAVIRLALAWRPSFLPPTVAGAVTAGVGPSPFVLAPAAALLSLGLFRGVRYRTSEGTGGGPAQAATVARRGELVDHLELPVLLVDASLRVTYANPAAALLLRPRSTMLGESAEELFGEAAPLLAALGRREADVQEFELVRGGGARSFEAWLTPLEEVSGRHAGTLVTLFDLAAWRRAEAPGGLAEEEEARRSQALLDAFHEALLRIGRGDRLGVLFDVVLTGAASAVAAPHAALYLVDQDAEALRRRVALGGFEALEEPPLRKDEGLAGRVWATARPATAETFPEAVGDVVAVWGGTAAGVPLRHGARTLGVLLVVRRREDLRPFPTTELEALERFADLAALAAHNLETREHSERAEAELTWLDRLDATIARGAPDTVVLELALTAAREAAGFDRSVAWLASPDGRTLEASAWMGLAPGPEAGHTIQLDGSVPLVEAAFQGDQEIVLPGGGPLPERFRPSGPAAASPLVRVTRPAVLPLRGADGVLGVLLADDQREGVDLAPRLRALRRIAVRAGQALDRAHTGERLASQATAASRNQALLTAALVTRENLIEALGGAYFETDLRGTLTRVSTELAQLVGADAGTLKGTGLEALAAPDATDALVDLFGRVLRTGRVVRRASWALQVHGGAVEPVELSIGVLRDERGVASGYFGLVTPRGR